MTIHKTAVILYADDITEREVIKVDYTFTQPTDLVGEVAGSWRGGKINITVIGRNDGNTDLIKWMNDKRKGKTGKIEFTRTTDGVLSKTINFEDAYCVDYTESWEEGKKTNNLLGEPTHTEKISLTCRKVDIEGVVFNFPWNEEEEAN
jgi:hypothetical protein